MELSSDEDFNKNEPNSSNVFENFSKLPDLVQAEILDKCDFKTLMNVTRTSKLLNNFVFSDLQLAKRIQLKIGSISDDSMEILQASSRSYRVLHISGLTEEKMKFLELKGSFIRELTIYHPKLVTDQNLSHPNNINLLIKVLALCKNLEKFHIHVNTELGMNDTQDGKLVSLPKLKVLKTTLSMLAGILSNVHLDVHGLIKLHIYQECNDFLKDVSVDILEEFILQQNNLKTLKIYAKLPRGLFPEHRLKDVKFRLESFGARTFVFDSCELAENFFQMQRESLKKVKMTDFIDRQNFEQNRDKHMRMIQEIFSLPQLKCLKVLKSADEPTESSHTNDINYGFSTFVNKSIESIYCDYKLKDFAGIKASHPNLKKLKLSANGVIDGSPSFVIDFPTEYLEMINVDCDDFAYKPAILPSDPQRAADDFLEFLRRQDYVSCITIGDASWIDNDFSLPLNFWKNIPLFLKKKKKFVAYNLNNEESMVLARCENIRRLKVFRRLKSD